MGSKLISNQANRANNSPRANRDHGSRPLLARRQGRFWFYLQSGQQPAQPCCIWEHDHGVRKPRRGRMAHAKDFGWAIYAAGFVIWSFGYFSAGHAPVFDWDLAT